MQTRRTPLQQVPQTRRRSSLLSLNSAASPHTPRSSGCFDACPPPVCYAQNRKSTDSWNSSNADDMEFDWRPDQALLLTRTLDALPAHLVTPFNGSIPPSNLLDKVARGVASAKGPVDWPHSIRATRVKLLELARTRAKEDALAEKRRHIIQEEDLVEIEDGSSSSYTHDPAVKPLRTVGIGPRRPLYRQSSMDFIKPGAADLKDNPNIAKLSNRLQRNDRTFPSPAFHPYARTPRGKTAADENRRSESPPHSSDVPGLISPSTPSSTTLDSISSLSSAPLTLGKGLAMGLRPRALRRSASSLSSSSIFSSSASSNGGIAHNPVLQRVRRSDSFSAGAPPPPPPPKDYSGLKRAPSYGALAQDARAKAGMKAATQETTAAKEKERHVRHLSTGSCPSSDEEEKARTRRAKKIRTRPSFEEAATPPPSVPPSPSVVGSPFASPRATRVNRERDSPLESPKVRRVVKSYLYNQSTTFDATDSKDIEKPAKVEVKEREQVKDAPGHRTTLSRDKAVERDMHVARAAKDKEHAPTSPPARARASAPRAPRMSLQRNPSMFGAELPPAQPVPVLSPAPRTRQPLAARAPLLMQNITLLPANAPVSPMRGSMALSPAPTSPTCSPALAPPLSSDPASPRLKTLRRVRRLAGGRRISFGSMIEEDGANATASSADGTTGVGVLGKALVLEEGFGGPKRAREGRERGLGSAFQMS